MEEPSRGQHDDGWNDLWRKHLVFLRMRRQQQQPDATADQMDKDSAKASPSDVSDSPRGQNYLQKMLETYVSKMCIY